MALQVYEGKQAGFYITELYFIVYQLLSLSLPDRVLCA